jgi:hypothetical protein
MMFGSEYHLICWLSCDGERKESWIPSIGHQVNANAYNMPTVNGNFVDPELDEISESCNTAKDKHVKRIKIAGVNIITFPCGTILSVEELYGSESLSQVLLPLYSLMKSEDLQRDVKVLIHDNACRFAAFVKKRSAATPLMQHLADLDMRVDRHHFKNHVGLKCRKNHNPDSCELLKDTNTSVMEQVNNWFGRYRHSARYMNQARFSFYLLLACHLNNRFRAYKRLIVDHEADNYPEENSSILSSLPF